MESKTNVEINILRQIGENKDPKVKIGILEEQLKEMTKNYQTEKEKRKEYEVKYEILEKIYLQHILNFNNFLQSVNLPTVDNNIQKTVQEEYQKRREIEKISYEFEVQNKNPETKKKREERSSFWEATIIDGPIRFEEVNEKKGSIATITSLNGEAIAEQITITDDVDELEEEFFKLEPQSLDKGKKRSWTEIVEMQLEKNKNKLEPLEIESRRLSEVDSDKIKKENEILAKKIGQNFFNQSVNLSTDILEKLIMGIELSIKSTVNMDDKKRKFKVNDNTTQKKFDFIDYAPNLFNKLRELASIDDKQFRKSIAEHHMKVVITPGKSGAILFFTGDKKLMLKTVSDSELSFLVSILPSYYEYCKKNPSTLICRLLALYTLKTQSFRLHFITMENIFPTQPDEIYDLKGSTHGRVAKEEEKIKKFFKDNDFLTRKTKLIMKPSQKQKFFHTIMSDVEFLRTHDIMDYSLLLGISELKDEIIDDDPKNRFTHFKSSDGKHNYSLGIIDILQEWNLKKMTEMGLKSFIHEKKKISSVPPDEYSKRFLDFIFSNLISEN